MFLFMASALLVYIFCAVLVVSFFASVVLCILCAVLVVDFFFASVVLCVSVYGNAYVS